MLPTLHPRRVLQTITPESPRLPPDPNEAFELLYRRYYTPIERYLLHQLGDPEQAADLCHEVFLRVWKDLPRYEDRGLSMLTWIRRIAHARLIDSYRTNKRRPQTALDEYLAWNEDEEGDRLVREAETSDVRRYVLRLPPIQRTIIEMYYFEDRPFPEIAQAIERGEEATRSLHHRAILRLRAAFQASFEQLSLVEIAHVLRHSEVAPRSLPQRTTLPVREMQTPPVLVEQLSFFS